MIRAMMLATTLLVLLGCGAREGGTIAVKSESVTLYLDKPYFDEDMKRVENGPAIESDPDPERYRLLSKGSRLRVVEELPLGYMVTVESAIREDNSHPEPAQFHEDPSLKGKVGWVGKRDLGN